MSGPEVGTVLIHLGALLLLAWAVGILFVRVHVPAILGALVTAMAARYTPLGAAILEAPTAELLGFLGELGAMFLLFYIGLQIDPLELRRHGRGIVVLTVLASALPFLFGLGAMYALGYSGAIAIVIAMTRIPTAEAVVVPILDEFRLTDTKVGQFIIGAGTLDDVFEILLIVVASGWIALRTGTGAGMGVQAEHAVLGLAALATLTWISRRWLLPRAAGLLPPDPRYRLLLAVAVMLLFSGLAELSGAGLVIGALAAGVAMRPALGDGKVRGAAVFEGVRGVTYGFLGPFFFLHVGLHADLAGAVDAPLLTLSLYFAGLVGKLSAALALVPSGTTTLREAVVTGIGLDARLTTEVVVAQLLLTAGIIDLPIFTALVAASSLSSTSIPLVFAFLVRRWQSDLAPPTDGGSELST